MTSTPVLPTAETKSAEPDTDSPQQARLRSDDGRWATTQLADQAETAGTASLHTARVPLIKEPTKESTPPPSPRRVGSAASSPRPVEQSSWRRRSSRSWSFWPTSVPSSMGPDISSARGRYLYRNLRSLVLSRARVPA